uniref:restriction endonuclease n=1 Tax=Brachyspira catarrhinii TaxID=2528966 RepID=UPI003F4BB44D
MERNYFLHRISYCYRFSYHMLANGYLSIGYEKLFSQELYEIVENGDYHGEFKPYVESIWGKCPKGIHHLWRFIHDFKKGDYIIVPQFGGLFSIYEIIGDNFIGKDHKELKSVLESFIDTEDYEKLDFFWKVKPIYTNIKRAEYANAELKRKMHYGGTNISCNTIAETINELLVNLNNNIPVNLTYEILNACSRNIFDLVRNRLNPDKFEKLIALYFKQCGADNIEIPSKIDNPNGDCDIQASFDLIRTIIHVQAKFHTYYTDQWAIEQINNFLEYKSSNEDGYSHIGWVISSCDDFSDDAKNLAIDNNILLINGKTFSEMLIKAGISSLEGNI